MIKDSVVRARVNSHIKESAENVFKELGLTTSQAITIFLTRVTKEQGIPFDLKIPNETTKKAMQEAKDGIGETLTYEEFISKK